MDTYVKSFKRRQNGGLVQWLFLSALLVMLIVFCGG